MSLASPPIKAPEPNLATRGWDIQPRTFGYDLAGRLTGANIPNYPLSYAYDAAGRPTSRGAAWSAGYGWDDAGNLNALTYPDGTTTVTYQYDPLNRTTKALIGTAAKGTLNYDSLGRRQTLTFADSSSQTWGYDNADRVTSIAHVFPNDTGNNVTFSYGYDPVGRGVSKSVDNGAYDYAPAAASVAYAAANALNQYPSVGGYPYSYWPEGGLKETDTLAANYDELGTMIEGFVTLTPGVIDPANGVYVGMDALGHKYFHEAQTVAGQPYPFIYHSTDGLRPETILEWVYQGLNGAPQALQGTRRYVLGPGPDERWAYIGPNGGTYNPHTDREGTLIALSNGGVVSQIYTWDAYGHNTNSADETSTGPAGYLYRYTGQRLDPATSLYDYKARDYSPVLGRFYQPDPAGVDQGPNLYAYVGDEPVDYSDPKGTDGPPLPSLATLGYLGEAAGAEILGGGPEDPIGDAAAGYFLRQAAGSYGRDVIISAAKSAQGTESGGVKKATTGPGSVSPHARDPKRNFSPKDKQEKLNEQGGKCANCGKSLNKRDAQGHHEDRHADGGKTEPDNLKVVCEPCHKEIHAGPQ